MKAPLLKAALLAIATAVALAVAGCSGGGGSVHESTNVRASGNWQYVSGPVIANVTIGTPTWLVLDSSGTGTLFSRAPAHGLLGCANGAFAVLNDTVLSLQLANFVTTFYVYAVHGDTLTLTDADNRVSTFTRQATIPATDVCEPLAGTADIHLPAIAQVSQRTSLASDGTNLRYTNDLENAVVSFNPVTQSVGAPIVTASGFKFVIAMQDADFWGDCFCGGSPDAGRTSPADVLIDSFDTSTPPISDEISIRSGTWDGAHLWIAGYGYSNNAATVEEIDSEAEPDTLVSSFTFPGSVDGLAFKDGKLFLLSQFVGFVIAEVDPATGDVLHTYALPSGYYTGLAAAGGKLYTLNEASYPDYSVMEIDGI